MRRRIYDQDGHAHFITFPCYRRRRLLDGDAAKRTVLDDMGAQLARTNGTCVGFVIMPNHVHAIVRHAAPQTLAEFMKQWKRMSSYRIARLAAKRPAQSLVVASRDPVWQARYYDFNLHSRGKVEEKLAYMHQNPVRAGLVTKACDWPWSSARYYELGADVGVPLRWVE